MSLITKNNYEAFLLDYVEENLSPELTAELMLFLEQNPELKEDLADFEIHTLTPSNEASFDKSNLKKENAAFDYEALMIAEIEGVNSPENTALLSTYLAKNPIHQKEFEAYQKTKLVAPTVLFENKSALKKKNGIVIPLFWKYSSAAAAVILVLWSLNWTKEEQVYHPFAERYKFVEDSVGITNVLDGVVIVEENQIAEGFQKVRPQLKLQKKNNKEDIKETPNLKDVVQENSLAANTEDENKIVVDSATIVAPGNSLEKEEVLYAENNVTITYEDEILDDGTPTLQKRKITKLDMLRAVVKSRINGNLDKGKEKVMVAMNTNPLNLLRKNKKKE
ncbi:MAG: hypothetical protein ACPGSO_07655 [Vicingaceae bacterium]